MERNAWLPLPIQMGHWEGALGPIDDIEGGDWGMSQKGLDNRGDHRVSPETRETGKL